MASGQGRLDSVLGSVQVDRRRLLQGAAALGIGASTGVVSLRETSAQGDPATLVIGLNGSPTDLDPHSQYDYRSVIPIRGPYEGLIILKDSETDQYDGVLAETWEANEDKSVWTFHLREGVTFQDGSPCDAEAVRASYERLLTMQKGAYNVVARFVPDPSHITVPDAKTVVFDLGKPQPLFESAMGATYGTQVVNVKVAMEHEEDGDFGNTWMMSNAEGTGTGPYRITGFEPGENVTLEKYDGYWAGWEGDHFDKVIVRTVNGSQTLRQLLESGEVDITDRIALPADTVKDMESNPDLKVDRKTTTEVVYMTMTEYGPLESAAARQAMCYAFPYQEVILGAYAGYAKQPHGAVAEATRGFDPATFQYTTDLAKAKELLATAGVAEGTKLTLMVSGTTTISELFQANLAEIGITLDIQSVDTNLFTGTFYGDLPVEERPAFMIWSWWPDYNDAWNHLDPQVSCDPHGSANAGMYCNERVDELLKASHDAANPEDYQTAMSEIQQILSRDDPSAIYYAEPEWTTTMRKDIQGFFLNPINLGTYNLYKLHRGSA